MGSTHPPRRGRLHLGGWPPWGLPPPSRRHRAEREAGGGWVLADVGWQDRGGWDNLVNAKDKRRKEHAGPGRRTHKTHPQGMRRRRGQRARRRAVPRAVTSPPSGRAGHRAAGKVPVVSAAASRRSAGWRGSDAPPPPRPRRRAGRGRAGRAPGGVPRLPAAGTPDGWVGAAAEGGGRRARAVAVGRARRRRRLGPRPCGPRGSARCRGGRRARPGAPCRGTCASQRRPRRAARRRGGGCRVGGDGGGGRHPTRRRGCHRHRRSCGGCPQQRGAPQRSAGMRESAPTARWGHPRGLRGGGRGGFNEEGQSLQRSCRSWRHAAYS